MPCQTSVIRDQQLIQIVDRALEDAAKRSGEWLACKAGCAQCCSGVFAINLLDARRLRAGLVELENIEPERAQRVRARAQESWQRLSLSFPGNISSGILGDDMDSKRRFATFANEEPCPALDPGTQTCDLYAARPLTCRVFGPPVRSAGGLGICELCFHGATDQQIAECEMSVDPDDLESTLLQQIEQSGGLSGETIVASCLAAG